MQVTSLPFQPELIQHEKPTLSQQNQQLGGYEREQKQLVMSLQIKVSVCACRCVHACVCLCVGECVEGLKHECPDF